MKKLILAALTVLLLTGCGDPESYETMSDDYVRPERPQEAETVLELNPDGVRAVMALDETGSLYLCDGYSVALQTMESGDLDATVLEVTGYTTDRLRILHWQDNGIARYECVWTAAGEGDDQVGRTVILDDGNYHYTLTVMAEAGLAGSLTETWQALLASFHIQ